MIEIYEECVRLLLMGQHVVLATVFEARGSSPRRAGAKMIVRADGSIKGTIGGGSLEHDAIREARRLFETKRSSVYAFELTGNEVAGMDMICGGSGEMWLHYLDAGEENNLKVCSAAVKVLGCRDKACIVTEIGIDGLRGEREFGLIADNQDVIGNLRMIPKAFSLWSRGKTGLSLYAESIEKKRYLMEPIDAGSTVVVFGAGHVSQEVIPLCKKVGFQTMVLDDRLEYACRNRFPDVDEIIVLDSFEKWPDLIMGKESFIVILTRGHLYDKTVLMQALRTQAGYIGMIGSRRKRDKIYQALLEEGFTQQDIERVHSPIGMDIGAETPAEIAVSIVGELIKVRAEQEK